MEDTPTTWCFLDTLVKGPITTIEKKIPDILQISAGVTEDVLYSGDVWHVCKLMKHTYSSVRDNCFFKEM